MRTRPLVAFALALPLLAACSQSGGGSQAAGGDKIAVTVNDQGCTPASIEAPAGTIVFAVTNGGTEAGEFEVLEGTQVLDEVEDIVPGVTQDMTIDLEPGTYELICYLDDSPRGTLTVTEAAAS
jgi:iron uptake system EfeUOB component EfeO/EfeM